MTIVKAVGLNYEFVPLSIAWILWKRRWFVTAIVLCGSAASFAIVRYLPSVYRSEALILVDSQKISDVYVQKSTSSELQDRLASISQQILSSTRLKKIVDKFPVYQRERKGLGNEEIIDLMRKDISINVEKGWARDQPGAFRVGYRGTNPVLITDVANQLANLFVEEDSRSRERQATGTLEFLDSQLKEAKEILDNMEAKISRYKFAHNGELPQQEQTLIGALHMFQVELQGNQDAVSRAQQNKTTLQSALRAAEASERLYTSNPDDAPTNLRSSALSHTVRSKQRSDVLQDQYDQLSLQYTPKHPKMRALASEIDFQRSQEREEAMRDHGNVETLKAQLALAEQELKSRNIERQAILRGIVAYQARMERVPWREQEMSSLTRDYEISKANYKSLLDKKLLAGMTSEMEKKQQTQRFTLLDPARVPEKPISPNALVLKGFGALLSLVLGLACALAREAEKNAVLGEWELPANMPVLGRVPFIKHSLVPAQAAPSRHLSDSLRSAWTGPGRDAGEL